MNDNDPDPNDIIRKWSTLIAHRATFDGHLWHLQMYQFTKPIKLIGALEAGGWTIVSATISLQGWYLEMRYTE